MSTKRNDLPTEDGWNIKDGDYQRGRNVSNREIAERRRKRTIKALLLLFLVIAITIVVSHFIVRQMLHGH